MTHSFWSDTLLSVVTDVSWSLGLLECFNERNPENELESGRVNRSGMTSTDSSDFRVFILEMKSKDDFLSSLLRFIVLCCLVSTESEVFVGFAFDLKSMLAAELK